MLTLFVLLCPGVDQKLMQSLLSSFVHPFSHCKSLMSISGTAFKWVHSLEKNVMIRIPPDVREELFIAALHLLVACTNIHAPVSSHVTCSGATLTTAGVVESRVSRDLSLALYHHSQHKGAYTRLDWTQTDWCLQPWKLTKLPDVLCAAVRAANWKCCAQYDFSIVNHVNIQERHATLSALEFHCDQGGRRMRVLNGTDSRVFLGAWAKGRSSSVQLNNVIRRSAGRCILFSLVLAQFWLDTKHNPADDLSRRVPVRAPTRAPALPLTLLGPRATLAAALRRPSGFLRCFY